MAISHGLTTSLFQSLQQAGAERGMEELRQRLFSLHLAPRTKQQKGAQDLLALHLPAHTCLFSISTTIVVAVVHCSDR